MNNNSLLQLSCIADSFLSSTSSQPRSENSEEQIFYDSHPSRRVEWNFHEFYFSKHHCKHFQKHLLKGIWIFFTCSEHLKECKPEGNQEKSIDDKVNKISLEDTGKHANVFVKGWMIAKLKQELQIYQWVGYRKQVIAAN